MWEYLRLVADGAAGSPRETPNVRNRPPVESEKHIIMCSLLAFRALRALNLEARIHDYHHQSGRRY